MGLITDKKKRDAALELALQTIEKDLGKGLIIKQGSLPDVEFIQSGIVSIDRALGGGIARGRIIEGMGQESTGKTTFTLHLIASAQKQGLTCAFVDMEHALDPKYATALGVKMKKLLISQPDFGEQALDVVDRLVRSNAVDLVIVDSVAALTPKAEIEGDMGDTHVGRQARMMSQALRKLTAIVATTNTTVFFLNQLRINIGVMYGDPNVTTGGNALKFYSSQRMKFATSNVREGGDVTRKKAKITIIKNKVAPPFQVAEVLMQFGTGIDRTQDILSLAVDMGFVDRSGSWYSYGEDSIGQGEKNAVDYLEANPKVLKEIEDQVVAL